MTDLGGYRIYYGTNRSSLPNFVQTGLGTARYVIEDLAAGTWYFAIKAYNRAGVESNLSNVASKTVR